MESMIADGIIPKKPTSPTLLDKFNQFAGKAAVPISTVNIFFSLYPAVTKDLVQSTDLNLSEALKEHFKIVLGEIAGDNLTAFSLGEADVMDWLRKTEETQKLFSMIYPLDAQGSFDIRSQFSSLPHVFYLEKAADADHSLYPFSVSLCIDGEVDGDVRSRIVNSKDETVPQFEPEDKIVPVPISEVSEIPADEDIKHIFLDIADGRSPVSIQGLPWSIAEVHITNQNENIDYSIYSSIFVKREASGGISEAKLYSFYRKRPTYA